MSLDRAFKLLEGKECVTFFGSARLKSNNFYYIQALKLSEILSKKYTIITGGGPGIMQAGNKGAFESGSETIGFNIKLPNEQRINPFVTDFVEFNDLSDRKKALIMRSKAFVVFAGGFGTMDELFEILTLSKTKLKKSKIYLFDKKFYSPLVDYFENVMLKEGVISKNSLKLFKLVDSIDEIVKDLMG